MTDSMSIRCAQDGCTVPSGGRCLEGFHPPVDCPFYGRSAPVPAVVDPSEEEDDPVRSEGLPESGWHSLPSGLQMDASSAAAIMKQARSRVVVLAGGTESGKTTLLASLFDCFHDGTFAGFRFAGSRTLVAFEQRCHLSRLASMADRPRTPRTVLGTSGFLHLRLQSEGETGGTRDLLFWDFTGEVFQRARDSAAEARKLQVIRRADHFVLLVDGEQLVSPAARHKAASDARTLLRSLLDADVLLPHTNVQIVISKWDVIQSAGGDAPVHAFLEAFRAQIRSEFEGRIPKMDFHETAARPDTPVLPFAYGLQRLTRAWVNDPAPLQLIDSESVPPGPHVREMDRFTASEV